MNGQAASSSRARYKRLLEDCVSGKKVWTLQAPDAVMILSSQDGEDGVAVFGTRDAALNSLSPTDLQRGYEPVSESLSTWISDISDRLCENELLIAGDPLDQGARGFFVRPMEFRQDLIEMLSEKDRSEWLLLDRSLRIIRSKHRSRATKKE